MLIEKIHNTKTKTTYFICFEVRATFRLNKDKYYIETWRLICQFRKCFNIGCQRIVDNYCKTINPGIATRASNNILCIKSVSVMAAHCYERGKMLKFLIF